MSVAGVLSVGKKKLDEEETMSPEAETCGRLNHFAPL